jgi:hypothetical protein
MGCRAYALQLSDNVTGNHNSYARYFDRRVPDLFQRTTLYLIRQLVRCRADPLRRIQPFQREQNRGLIGVRIV